MYVAFHMQGIGQSAALLTVVERHVADLTPQPLTRKWLAVVHWNGEMDDQTSGIIRSRCDQSCGVVPSALETSFSIPEPRCNTCLITVTTSRTDNASAALHLAPLTGSCSVAVPTGTRSRSAPPFILAQRVAAWPGMGPRRLDLRHPQLPQR